MRVALLCPILLLAACPPPSSDDKIGDDTAATDDTGGNVEIRDFSYFVNVTTPWTGNTDACIDGQNQVVDPTCQVDQEIPGTITDFQTEDAVPDATFQLWLSDDLSGDPDIIDVADGDGNIDFTAPACTPIAYGTSTPPEWQETKDTYEVHQVFGYATDGESFNSVSESTSRLIPSLIGVEWDQSKAIIAGTAYDCDTEPMQYTQIYVHDSAGLPPETGDVYYFSESGGTSLPTDHDTQPYTNTNGLWVVMNIPAGTWTAEVWGYDETLADYVMLGATVLQIQAGSVTISNIYTGITDGVWYPSSCLSACGG